VSEPIDLDDLQRVGVKVREKTDDNWLADMVEIACAEIARLREERLTAGERDALELSLELEWPKTSEQWKALAACLGPVCVAPANEHKVAIRGLLDRLPLPPGADAKEVNRE
jgi:hypothetical protein